MNKLMSLGEEQLNQLANELIPQLQVNQLNQIYQQIEKDITEDKFTEMNEIGHHMTPYEENLRRKQYLVYYAKDALRIAHGGNKKNKPKIYKNKIIQGKEKNIYKIPGSRKDYIKYKGEFITVKDFIKSKNK